MQLDNLSMLLLLLLRGGGAAPLYFYKPVTITGSSAGAQTDYPVKVTLAYESEMNADFSDVRFKDSAGSSDLSFWLESKTDSTTATFWVKVPAIPASPSTVVIRAYYGRAAYTSASDGENVFSFFDDFSGMVLTNANTTNAASTATPSNTNLLGENIVYDDVTGKYWWAMEDRRSGAYKITLASADTIDGTWTVEASPVLSESGHHLTAPHLFKDGGYWYLYYGRNDNDSSAPGDIYVQKSTSVNTGYSDTGISNPILSRGGSSSWEENRVLEPYVFKVGSTYYMFYMGETVSTLIEKVGYATSSAPDSGWTKYGSNPVLAGDTGAWDAGQDKAADPWVIEANGGYYVGVAASASGKNSWRTGAFFTTDFATYTACDNPILGFGGSGAFDEGACWRGAVQEFDGAYYLSYAAVAAGGTIRSGITTITFETEAIPTRLDTDKWTPTGSPIQAAGIATVTNTAYFKSTSSFGAGYALRSRHKFATSGNGVSAFRDGTAQTYLQIIANLGGANFIQAYQNSAGSTSNSGDVGNPGAYAVYEIQRNGATSGIYLIDDSVVSILTTNLTPNSLPVTYFNNTVDIDWAAVRKYVSPEPSVSVGSEAAGYY